MRTTALLSFAALLVLAACGGDSSSMMDGGPGDGSVDLPMRDTGVPTSCAPSDGTPMGDCVRFDCLARMYSPVACPDAGIGRGFDCSGLGALPASYQTMVQSYFTGCPGVWPTLMPADVPLMGGGTFHASICGQFDCSLQLDGNRTSPSCAPLSDPGAGACDLPNPM